MFCTAVEVGIELLAERGTTRRIGLRCDLFRGALRNFSGERGGESDGDTGGVAYSSWERHGGVVTDLDAFAATLEPALPKTWTVYVLTDSGLRSKTLFLQVQAAGWIPMMRVDASQGMFQKAGQDHWVQLHRLVWRGMSPRYLQGLCFKGDAIPCTLICLWEARYQQPCLILTSRPPRDLHHHVYALRYWIECGFKDFKRGLFHWEHTKMRSPQRAERLWLVLTIALLLLTVWGDTPLTLAGVTRQQAGLSTPLFGALSWLVTLLRQHPLPSHLQFSPYQLPP